ncbi:hypothetical protein EV426DRAFT_701748 [Tirmania nivea]|nr:hypothetical protein EV426DRAFT_701748 [Tirmania nivea]
MRAKKRNRRKRMGMLAQLLYGAQDASENFGLRSPADMVWLSNQLQTSCIFSYVDDVNPLVITAGLSKRQHNEVIKQVDRLLEDTAVKYQLKWDAQKETRLDFGEAGKHGKPIKTLGIIVDRQLHFTPHIKAHSQGDVLPSSPRETLQQ